jgi:hypothetical protein
MRSICRRLVATAVTTAALAIAAPLGSAGAQVPAVGVPYGGFGPGCPTVYGPSGLGDVGSIGHELCGGVVFAFVGPEVGQVSTVMGPTIIGSAVNAPITVSAGPVGQATPVGP